MSRSSSARLAAGAAATIVAVGTSLALGATAASAATASHTVVYTCKIPVLGTEKVTAAISLSAPAKTTAGKTVKLSVKLQPTGLPAVSVTDLTVKSVLTESGAQKGTVSLSEFLKSASTGSLSLNLSGSVKLTKAGTVKLTAGKSATFALTNSIIGKATLTCNATSSLPVLGTISVGKAGAHGHTSVSRD
jgi:uncharacterized cupredoxin-like copper-binding protein